LGADSLVITQTCSSCQTEKALEDFVRDKNRENGRYSRCRACTSDYYQRNSSQIRATNQEYRDKNRSRVRAWNKKYGKTHFFKTVAWRLQIKEKGARASYKELASLWKIQRGMCVLTERRLNRQNCQLDHIIPIVRGGSSTIENLRWVHRDVNYAKRDLFDEEFIALCQEVTLANLRKERS
jgi:5-methylcytosine-specific restriction endonuclease McrA